MIKMVKIRAKKRKKPVFDKKKAKKRDFSRKKLDKSRFALYIMKSSKREGIFCTRLQEVQGSGNGALQPVFINDAENESG